MRVYVAGPMRGIPEFNFPAFDRAANDLRAAGHTVFNPAEMDRADGVVPTVGGISMPFEWYIARDINVICMGLPSDPGPVDCVAVLPGWENSQGAGMEVETILRLGRRAIVLKEESGSWALGDVLLKRAAVVADAGKKDDGLRYDLIPALPLALVAEVYTLGAKKYADNNWRHGIPWHKMYRALISHANRFWSGESRDPDGQHHLASVVFMAMSLMEYELTAKQHDDRFVGGGGVEEITKKYAKAQGG